MHTRTHTDGPFFISCNRESIFLSVSDSQEVEATQDIKYASKFFIVRCDEGDDHFFIVHEASPSNEENLKENVAQFEKVPPVPMYLRASINWRRRSTPMKPLMMKMNVNSRLTIHSRRDKESHPAKLTEWVSQKEVFFIKCEDQSTLIRTYVSISPKVRLHMSQDVSPTSKAMMIGDLCSFD